MTKVLHPLAGEGRITSGYGWRQIFGQRQWHRGIDFAGVPVGTPVVAVADGIVHRADNNDPKGYGLQVIVRHTELGLFSQYGHLDSYVVRPGERVKAGQTIGMLGNSGRSTGAHLHWELRKHAQARTDIDPTSYLP